MRKYLDKKSKYEVDSPAKNEVEILNSFERAFPFISFRYSYREISSSGGKTHVRSQEKSFKNGKFKSEEFEGTLPAGVYTDMVGEMQKLFFNQMEMLMKPFSLFLPSRSKK
ncbi:MAG: hypothetical protein ABFD50_13035 [Smithella sp.]